MKTIILLTVLVATGCCSLCEPEVKPLPPDLKLEGKDLRFICEGWAYKSVTVKDYIGKDYNITPSPIYEGKPEQPKTASRTASRRGSQTGATLGIGGGSDVERVKCGSGSE